MMPRLLAKNTNWIIHVLPLGLLYVLLGLHVNSQPTPNVSLTSGEACSSHCKSRKCFSSGVCLDGCEPGYKLPHCKIKCPDFTFGQDCGGTCSILCKARLCHHTNGSCLSCLPGYTGRFCNEACHKGQFGTNCMQSCSTECFKHDCDAFTGNCLECRAGKHGPYCNQDCPNGRYGKGCHSFCSDNCRGRLCDPINGRCILGCEGNYQAPFCIKCMKNYFGSLCLTRCSTNCLNRSCNIDSGRCSSCKYGWTGFSCDRVCSESCESGSCDQATGDCLPCPPGASGDLCRSGMPSIQGVELKKVESQESREPDGVEGHNVLSYSLGIFLGVLIVSLVAVFLIERKRRAATQQQTQNKSYGPGDWGEEEEGKVQNEIEDEQAASRKSGGDRLKTNSDTMTEDNHDGTEASTATNYDSLNGTDNDTERSTEGTDISEDGYKQKHKQVKWGMNRDVLGEINTLEEVSESYTSSGFDELVPSIDNSSYDTSTQKK